MTDRSRKLKAVVRALSLAAVLLCVSGCGGGAASAPTPPVPAVLQGVVMTGQSAVTGSSVTLYAAGLSGNAQGATALANATTDSSGKFSFGAVACPSSSTQIYITARAGVPAGAAGRANASLLYMTALGDCGELASMGAVAVNEVTTVAATWPLTQFAGAAGVVGASATNATGLRNAFSVVRNLVNLNTGLAVNTSMPASGSTEVSKLNALANAIFACGNSDGTRCTALFAAASGVSGTPTNTLDAAFAIITNPARNVGAVYAASQAAMTFTPTLTKAPHDWTMSLTYGGCSSGCGGLNVPGGVAIDSGGDVWVANYFGGVVSEFSPSGRAVAGNGFAGAGLSQSYGIAIDAHDNVWVTNEQSVAGANNSRHGSVSEFSAAGAELSGYGYTGGGVYYPLAIAADPSGSMWVADYGSSSASLLSSTGAAISPSTGFAASSLPFVTSVAVDNNHNAWFAAQGAVVRVSAQGTMNSFSCCSSNVGGIAIDPSGNVWVSDVGTSSIVELSSSGVMLHSLLLNAGANSAQGVAVDGAGNVWTANYLGNSITRIDGTSATNTSPAAGFGLDAVLDEPYGIAIDASGTVWISNSGRSTVTAFPGLASPIRTPLLGPPVRP